MLNIQEQFINYNKSVRNLKPIYIVIHDTGSPGGTAQNNHDYFGGGDRGASADYFIDSNNIIQIIDTDNYYSWQVGDGHGAYGISNSNSVGIEMCIGSDSMPTDATANNTIDLVKLLMNKYGIGIDNVVRHYDASRKSCPNSFMANNWSKWYEFKVRVQRASNGEWVQGWNQNSEGWWYCTDLANKYYYTSDNGWQKIENEWYYFDAKGYAKQNMWFKDTDNKWYWFKDNCVMAKSCWLWIDSECYCFDVHGVLYINCKTPDNYYVDETGAWFK